MQGGVIVVAVQQWLNNSSANNEPNKAKRKVESTINTGSYEQKGIRR